jgi:hypothetical protein
MSDKKGKSVMFDDASFEVKQVKTGAHDTQGARDTQGRQRKQKHPRINMAFYGDHLDYLKETAWEARMSVTEYVNALVAEDRKKKGK